MNVSKVGAPCVQNFKGLNAEKILSKASGMNSWQQRLALGVSAMIIQPAIDMTNKKVDGKTRVTSAKRSLAKGFAGMLTGIIFRGGCMKAVELALKKDSAIEKLAKITAENKTEAAINKAKDYIKNGGGAKKYAAVIGTITALGVMMFTNFLIDAPLTNWITNKLSDAPENNNKGAKNE